MNYVELGLRTTHFYKLRKFMDNIIGMHVCGVLLANAVRIGLLKWYAA